MKNDNQTTNKAVGGSQGSTEGPPRTYAEDSQGWDDFWDETRADLKSSKDRKVVIVLTEHLAKDLIKSIGKEITRMSEAADRVEAAAAALAEDATQVKSAVESLKAVIAELQQGTVSEERLAAIADSLNATDAALDAVTAPEPAPAPQG